MVSISSLKQIQAALQEDSQLKNNSLDSYKEPLLGSRHDTHDDHGRELSLDSGTLFPSNFGNDIPPS